MWICDHYLHKNVHIWFSYFCPFCTQIFSTLQCPGESVCHLRGPLIPRTPRPMGPPRSPPPRCRPPLNPPLSFWNPPRSLWKPPRPFWNPSLPWSEKPPRSFEPRKFCRKFPHRRFGSKPGSSCIGLTSGGPNPSGRYIGLPKPCCCCSLISLAAKSMLDWIRNWASKTDSSVPVTVTCWLIFMLTRYYDG